MRQCWLGWKTLSAYPRPAPSGLAPPLPRSRRVPSRSGDPGSTTGTDPHPRPSESRPAQPRFTPPWVRSRSVSSRIQISQEAGQGVWYYNLFQNFPQFIVIHTVKGFGIVNKAEIDVFMELSCFFDDPADLGNLISGSSAFSKSSLNIWKFIVHILLLGPGHKPR